MVPENADEADLDDFELAMRQRSEKRARIAAAAGLEAMSVADNM